MKLKSIFFGFFFCFLSVFFSFSVSAQNEIQVEIDGNPIYFDVSPVIQNDSVLVPMRTIFEQMGYTIDWNEQYQVINGWNGSKNISMTINSYIAFHNSESVILNAPPILLNERTMVPLRFIAESTGANVFWDNDLQTVFITTNDPVKEDILEEKNPLLDSVVLISTNVTQGSGFILSSDGLIATNYHVIEGAGTVSIVFNNHITYTGSITVKGFDMTKDIAIIKIEKTGLTPVIIGNADDIEIGAVVTAIGSPMGNLNTVQAGTILDFNDQIISTNAKIEQGSSGGALFNERGEVIGITTHYDESGRYYSIPIKYLNTIETNGNYSLSEMAFLPNILQPPSEISVYYDEIGNANVFWAPIYDADGYYVYISDEENGVYIKKENPNNNSDLWGWGYPRCMEIMNTNGSEIYLKVTSVKEGQESSFSQAVKVVVNHRKGLQE